MLAAMKLGAVVIPATTLLTADDLRGPRERGRACATWIADAALARQVRRPRPRRAPASRSAARAAGWTDYDDLLAAAPAASRPTGRPRADDPLLLYFTSGTTAKPKLVLHTHASYPVGHLSTMYWLGLRPGDVHLNITLAGLGQARLELLLRAVERRARRVFVHNHGRASTRRRCWTRSPTAA